MARKIVITSGKGGVGKTTLAALVGARLAKKGKKTLIVDLDSALNNLDVITGVEGKIDFYLEDAVAGRCRAKQALVPVSQNLYVLESARTNNFLSPPQSVKVLVDGFSETFDYVLFDCPAGVDASFHRAVACADEAIVVVNLYPTSMRDADKVIGALKSYALKSVVAVANRVRRDLIASGKSIAEEDCEDILKVPVIASVPECDELLFYDGTPLSALSPAAFAIAGLVRRIIDENYSSRADLYVGAAKRARWRR